MSPGKEQTELSQRPGQTLTPTPRPPVCSLPLCLEPEPRLGQWEAEGTSSPPRRACPGEWGSAAPPSPPLDPGTARDG